MSGANSDDAVPRARARIAGWLLLALCCAVLVASAGSAAGATQVDAENDTEAPTWGNATVSEGSPAEVNVTFYDNGRIDRLSIAADDFNVTGREVTDVLDTTSIVGNGNQTGVAVLLRLDGPVDVDEATVSFRENGSVYPDPNSDAGSGGIADEAGNELTTGSVGVDYSSPDSSPPEWGTATRVTGTELNLTFYDNRGIDPNSVDADNFTVSPGSVESVSAVTNFTDGSRQGVYFSLYLEQGVNADEVTVAFSGNGSLADTDGNKLASGTRTVGGMDSVSPEFRGYTLDRINESAVAVHIATNEPLDGIRVNVTGPRRDRLTRSDFREHGGSGDTLFYTAEYSFSEQGSYSFVWERATDRAGNTLRLSAMRAYYYQDDAPDIVFDGPYSTTTDTTVTFSAAESADADGIESVRWRIDGGTVLSGETVDVAFASVGSHEVVLEVTDTEGNTAVERRIVQVSGTDPPVRISRQNASHARATIDGSGFVQQVRAGNGSIVEGSNISLERLDAAFPSGVNATLGLSARDRTPDALAATGLGLFEITHADVPVDRVTLRFRVDRAVLNRTGGDPADVHLYRLESGWTELPTTVVDRRSDSVVYAASSPGLSQFAVGVDADTAGPDSRSQETETPTESAATETPTERRTGTPEISISEVRLNRTSPVVNDTVRINVTATNTGAAAGETAVPVVLNGTTLATHQLAVPAGESRTREFVHDLPAAGSLTVAGREVATVGSGGGLLAAVPNPLALWPGGLIGTVLIALLGLVAVTYGVLKGLAIYLGY
jgi:hypothetical protein